MLLLMILFLINASVATARELQADTPETRDEQISVKKEKPESEKITIPNLIAYSTRLFKELIELQHQLDTIKPTDDAREALVGIRKILDTPELQMTMEPTDGNLTYLRLSDITGHLNQQQNNLSRTLASLNAAMSILSQQEEYWSREQEILKTWVKELRHNNSFSFLRKNIIHLQKTIDESLDRIRGKMHETLSVLNETSRIQIKLYNLKMKVSNRVEELRIQRWEQTSPTIFNREFYFKINQNSLSRAWENAGVALTKEIELIKDKSTTLLLLSILPLLLSTILIKNKNFLKQHPNWAMLSERPVAFAVFTSLILSFYWISVRIPHLLHFRAIICTLSIMLLAGKLEKNDRWICRFISILSLYLVLNIIIDFINLPVPLQRLYLLTGSLGWLSYFSYRFFSLKNKKHDVIVHRPKF